MRMILGNNGNIEATTLNLQVGGDFSYDDASNDFVWNAQNSLVVFGSAFITADDFSNYGAINVVNDFNVTATERAKLSAVIFPSP